MTKVLAEVTGSISFSQRGEKGEKGEKGDGMVVAYQQAASKPTSKPLVTSYETYKATNSLQNNWFKSAPSNGSVLTSGGSISGIRYNQNPIGGNWQSGVNDGGNTWYKSPAVDNNGIAKMQIHFTTSVDEQYVTFYIKAYSEEIYDFILVSEIDNTNVTRESGYSIRASGNGVEESVKLKCEKAGSHFVTIAYAKDVSGQLDNYDYGLVRMATNENYVYVSTLLYRCDGDVKDGVISWGSIYQAQGYKGDKGEKGDTGARGTKGALMREHDGFESGSYKYLSGAGEEAYIDVVCIKGKWYQCAKTYDNATSSPSLTDGHWTEMSNYKSIATHLLLAENANINMLGTNQINLYNPSGGAMYGSFRIVENNSDWSLWLGASTADSAPFGVTRGGAIKSTSGTIGGVAISQDKLGVGVADIGNHTFIGAILSSRGIFVGYKTSYAGAGYYAEIDPSGSHIQMYDKNGTTLKNISSPSLYVRKYTDDNTIINNIDKDYGAALVADVPRGVGVASLGNNVLGGLALSSCAGDFDIGSTDNLFQKNRGTVAYLTNSTARRFYLPADPHEGQVVIVIQGSTGNITFYHPGKKLVIQNKVKNSGNFYSGNQGQLNIFVYIGTMWYGTYSNG